MSGGSSVDDLVPRLRKQGYDRGGLSRRRGWVEKRTGSHLDHVGRFSFDPEVMRGNIENPIGVAQVPLGIAGPLLVHYRRCAGSVIRARHDAPDPRGRR